MMTVACRAVQALAVLLLAAGTAGAACPAGQLAVAGGCAPDAEVRSRIDAIVSGAMEQSRLKAVIAGVAVEGGAPQVEAWGVSMTGIPATPEMSFRNGAVAIAYLGTVLLQQSERGTLSLDEPLATWFPDYPRAAEVTPRMLIGGTSGYADYVTDPGFLAELYADPFRDWTPAELIAIGLGRPMVCDPGACWSYAHTNFVILGQVLEQATGRPLAALIEEGVLAPLGLTGTRSDQTAAMPEPVLHAFDAERGRYEESTYWNPSWTLADGAVMTSTVADVLASAAAIGEGRLLSPAAHAQQLAPDTARFPPWDAQRWYGFGVFVINGWVVQNPSFAGYAATMAHHPQKKLAIAAAVTVLEGAGEANYATDVVTGIAAYLAPDAPLR